MDPLLLISLFILVTVFAVIIFFVTRNRTGVKEPVLAAANVNAGRVAAPLIAGGRRRVVRREVRTANGDDSNDSDEATVFDDELEALKQSGKVGAKKLRKLEEKAERKAQREALEQDRIEKKERQEKIDKDRKRKEQLLLKEEETQLAEEKRLREEKKEQEEEAYQAMKLQFTVDEEGADALQEDEMQNLLETFLKHIKDNKVVFLEDLAKQFKLKTQDVIDRIQTLQTNGDLSGILDDRGKFIHITEEEYLCVAEFMRKRGRVTISELANNMNRLIELNPVGA